MALAPWDIHYTSTSFLSIYSCKNYKTNLCRIKLLRLCIQYNEFNLQWLPESVTFDLLSGRTDKAMNTLERVAQGNNKPMPVGRLVLDRMQSSNKCRWAELLSRDMCKTTILLWIIWQVYSQHCYLSVSIII